MTTTQTFDLAVGEDEQATALKIQENVDRGLEHLAERRFDAAIAAFKLAYQLASENSQVRDIVSHNLLSAYRNRVIELLAAGEPLHINRYLPELSELDLRSELRQDSDFRGRFADQMRSLSLDFYGARQHEPALFFIRKALSLEKCPSYYVDLTNALAWTKQPARLADYTRAYEPSDLGTHIFLACAPKSGSTFLKNVLQAVTGFKNMFSVYAALQNEQELDLPHLVKFGNVDTVTQQHSRASEANLQMMQAFGVKPVILTRNIFDTVASLLDFYTNGYVFSTYFDKETFLSFDQDQKIDLLISFVVPWYFQFVASWQKAEHEGRCPMIWLTYEEMVSDKPAAVAKVMDFYGVQPSPGLVEEKIAETEGSRDQNRFNRGVTGRGKTLLTDEQKLRIIALARHFPNHDFSMLGIGEKGIN